MATSATLALTQQKIQLFEYTNETLSGSIDEWLDGCTFILGFADERLSVAKQIAFLFGALKGELQRTVSLELQRIQSKIQSRHSCYILRYFSTEISVRFNPYLQILIIIMFYTLKNKYLRHFSLFFLPIVHNFSLIFTFTPFVNCVRLVFFG